LNYDRERSPYSIPIAFFCQAEKGHRGLWHFGRSYDDGFRQVFRLIGVQPLRNRFLVAQPENGKNP